MGVIDRVVVLRGVSLERHAAVPSSTLDLVEDALRKALGNEQIVPEWKRGVDGSSSLSCRAHLGISVCVGINRCDTDDAVSRKHAARAASAVEPDRPRRCVGIVEVVVFCRRGYCIANDRDWASECDLGPGH